MHMKIIVILCPKWDIKEMEKFPEHWTQRHSNILSGRSREPQRGWRLSWSWENESDFFKGRKLKVKIIQVSMSKDMEVWGVQCLGYCDGHHIIYLWEYICTSVLFFIMKPSVHWCPTSILMDLLLSLVSKSDFSFKLWALK